MSDFSVRAADRADRAELVRLLAEMKEHHRGFSPDDARFHVARDDLDGFAGDVLADPDVTVLVAEGHDRLLGFAEFRIFNKSWGRSCEVDLLAVDEKVRGNGIGAALMEEVERRARAAGAGGLRLNVSLGNDGARRFYERLGYLQSGVRLAKPLPS